MSNRSFERSSVSFQQTLAIFKMNQVAYHSCRFVNNETKTGMPQALQSDMTKKVTRTNLILSCKCCMQL